jgi:hypothetical protein
MNDMRHPSLARVAGLLVLGVFGCGLISSDITKVTFDLPPKHYVFSSQGFALPAGTPNMAVPCGPGTPVAMCPAPLTCVSGVCSASVPLTVYQTMNLKMEVPQLGSVNSQTLVDITLESMSYSVKNTANIAIPPIDLYLAPANVTSPSDPSAQKFGSVPAIPAGTNASGDVVKAPNADALFIMYGQNFGTPFNFIASTTVVVPTGTNPSGMVDITINGQIAAKL